MPYPQKLQQISQSVAIQLVDPDLPAVAPLEQRSPRSRARLVHHASSDGAVSLAVDHTICDLADAWQNLVGPPLSHVLNTERGAPGRRPVAK
jgi:hypothetical protein